MLSSPELLQTTVYYSQETEMCQMGRFFTHINFVSFEK